MADGVEPELSVREWARQIVAAQPSIDGGAIGDRLHQVCLACLVGLGMSGAVVSLRSASGSEAVAAASDVASMAAAELELTLGEGPSRDAFKEAQPVLVADVNEPRDQPWVGYTSAALQLGIHSVFAFPLHLGATKFGVLTMFVDSPQRLDRLRTARCLALADVAIEMLLSCAETGIRAGRLDPDLETVLDFRSEIYQAQGMVMAALGIDLPDALARMRAHSFSTQRTLHDVSLDIVAGVLTLTEKEIER